MHLSLRMHSMPHLAPDVLWRWMLLAFAVCALALFCYLLAMMSSEPGELNVAMAGLPVGPVPF